MKYIIGMNSFSTKDQIKNFAKGYMLRRVGMNDPIDVSWLVNLLELHRDWDEKRGPGLRWVEICKKRLGYDVWLHRVDGSRIDISWNYAISGSLRVHVMRAYRRVVSGDIRMRRMEFLKEGHTCYQCETALNQDNLQVDHVYPFSKLVDDYEANLINQMSFKEYHRRALLAPICRPCNQKKSDRLIEIEEDMIDEGAP